MKGSVNSVSAIIFIIILIVPTPTTSSRHISHDGRDHSEQSRTTREFMAGNPRLNRENRMGRMKRRNPDTLEIAGSSLPDCSHACGSCSPCRLVMVSYVCSTLEEAETCPMAYKCMCNNKSYPVP